MAAAGWALVLLLVAGCASALADRRATLSATDRGTI